MTDAATPQRFRGSLLWWDLAPPGRKTAYQSKGPAPVERAILTGPNLAIEFTLEGQSYLTRLSMSPDGSYVGTWEAGHGMGRKTGTAVCRLRPSEEVEEVDNRRVMSLEGTWVEEIDWGWAGKLAPVSSFA